MIEEIEFCVYGKAGILGVHVPDGEVSWFQILEDLISEASKQGVDPEMILMSRPYRERYRAYLGTLPIAAKRMPGRDGKVPEPELAYRHLHVLEDIDCPGIWIGSDMRRPAL